MSKNKSNSGANPKGIIEGIVMTMFDGRTNLCRQVVEQVREYFPDQVRNGNEGQSG